MPKITSLVKISLVGGIMVFGASLLAGFTLPVSAISTVSSRVAVTLSDIITLRILDSSASSEINSLVLDVTPTPNGVFTKNSFNVDVSTSNITGYKLYMTSIGTNPVSDASDNPTYTTDLINVDNTISDSIPTLVANSSVTEADFRARNSLYKNKWGYSLADLSITDTSAITYTDIPANTEQRLVDEKEEQTEHGQTPVTIGVNVSSSIASGTYKNKLAFTAVANPIPKDFSLSFDASTEDAVENLPETMTVSSVGSSYTFTIPSTAPTRTGYKIKEYNTKADGTGDSYDPGDSFEIVADDTNPTSTSKTLYVIWGELEPYYIYRSGSAGGYVNNLSVVEGGTWGNAAIGNAEAYNIDTTGYNYVSVRTSNFSFAYNSCALKISNTDKKGQDLYIGGYLARAVFTNPRSVGQTADLDISEYQGVYNIQLACGSGGLYAPGSASVSSSYIYLNMRNNQWETYDLFWLHN